MSSCSRRSEGDDIRWSYIVLIDSGKCNSIWKDKQLHEIDFFNRLLCFSTLCSMSLVLKFKIFMSLTLQPSMSRCSWAWREGTRPRWLSSFSWVSMNCATNSTFCLLPRHISRSSHTFRHVSLLPAFTCSSTYNDMVYDQTVTGLKWSKYTKSGRV